MGVTKMPVKKCRELRRRAALRGVGKNDIGTTSTTSTDRGSGRPRAYPLRGRVGIRYLRHGEAKEKPIGKGFDGSRNGSSPEEEAEPNEQGQILSLPVQSTPINPNAAPEGRNHRKPQSAPRQGRARRATRGRALARDERRRDPRR